MAQFAAIAAVGLQIAGQLQQGSAAKRAANYQAAQYEANAGQARASSQRAAIEKRRQSTLLASRAQAIGASSGGGSLDPSTINIISGIDAEGEYGALGALYQGEEAARGNITEANTLRYQGKQAKQNSLYQAAGTAGSFFSKYGGDMFTQAPAPIEYRDGLA